MSKLKQALGSGQFVVTGEIGPPKGVDLDKCLHDAEMLQEHVTAINVTDLQSAVLRIGSLAISARLVERDLEPVYQLTCRDRNRLALLNTHLGLVGHLCPFVRPGCDKGDNGNTRGEKDDPGLGR